MNSKNNKQRLFEVMGKVNPTFKPILNEYDNYNYPAGADADPNAPWNQSDDSLDYIETSYQSRYPKSFEVIAHSSDGKGTFSREGFEMLDDIADSTPENKVIFDYFNKWSEGGLNDEIVKSKEFEEMVDKLWNAVYRDESEFEWEYPDEGDAEDYGDYIRDLRRDEPDYFGEGKGLTEENYSGGGNSEALKKFIYADRLLGDNMTEEQAIQILDDAKSQLGIGDMEIFKANVTAGALYSLLSEYEGEMGGFNRY